MRLAMSNYYGPRVLPDSTRGMGMLAAQLQAVVADLVALVGGNAAASTGAQRIPASQAHLSVASAKPARLAQATRKTPPTPAARIAHTPAGSSTRAKAVAAIPFDEDGKDLSDF
jgi:phage tail tape-measure protein